MNNKTKLATRILLAGFATAIAFTMVPPNPAAAKSKKFEQWYDYSESKWKKGSKPARRHYASNKSPIRKRRVRIDKKYTAGTIIIDTSERRLYYVMKRGRAMKYGVGVGRDGFGMVRHPQGIAKSQMAGLETAR